MERSRFLLAAIAFLILPVAQTPETARGAGAETRPAAVAGQFYPSDPGQLKRAVEAFLKSAPDAVSEKPIALVVPHAGYVYSGQICADAYRQVQGQTYDTVVVLGGNHTTGGFGGISLGNYSALRTPLGSIPVDQAIVSALMTECRDCVQSSNVHQTEHSIEVQLPFIQIVFPKAKILPVVIHPPDYNMCVRFGKALAEVLKNRRTLIVISSDLSHYPLYRDTARVDRETLESIMSLDTGRFASLMKNLDAPNLATRACGEAAIIAGITAAKALGAKHAFVAGYANSGDSLTGDRSRTVGYGSVVLTSAESSGIPFPARPVIKDANPLQSSEKKALLAFARETILRYLTTLTLPLPRDLPARMSVPQGAFVTLKKNGELRGCIGHMSADMELGRTVGMMALQSAFNDSRFTPVTPGELKNLEIEISVLTPMRKVDSPGEIVAGRDGVLMTKGRSSAVFLPQVAVENKWDRPEMLDNLCRKAGLSSGCWKKDAKFQVFQADVFSESQFR